MNSRESKLSNIYTIAKAKRIPISCTIELTENCNFHCPHCFIKNIGHHYLAYQDYVSFINQFRERGGLYVTLTGGEALTHPDFVKMYRYTYGLGVSITVFTNGYLVNDEIVQLFTELPPRKIEISLYGTNDDAYALISNQSDAFAVVNANIEKLIKKNINVIIKTTLYQQIYKEFFGIKKFAEEHNLKFKYDFKLMPKRNGDKSNLEYQLKPETIIQLELEEDKHKLEQWKNEIGKCRKDMAEVELFSCGGGRYSCFLSCTNQLRICAGATFSSVDMYSFTFNEAWNEFEKYTKLKKKEDSKCIHCKISSLCDICPMWGYLMNDDVNYLGREVELHCLLAKERECAIQCDQ